MPDMFDISKSKYCRGVQCPKMQMNEQSLFEVENGRLRHYTGNEEEVIVPDGITYESLFAPLYGSI